MTAVVYRRLVISGHGVAMADLATEVRDALNQEGVRTQDLTGVINPGTESFEVSFFVRCRRPMQAAALLERIGGVEGVSRAEWTQIKS